MDGASKKLPIIIECFEKEAIWRASEITDLPLVYLMFFNNPLVSYNLTDIGKWAHGVGPLSDWLMGDGRADNETSKFCDEAHENMLAVHPYSLQDDFLKYTKDPIDENILYVNKGVDGVFTEFPHLTKAVFSKYGSKAEFPPNSNEQE